MRLRARLPLAALTLPIGLAVLGSCYNERATEPDWVLRPTMSTVPVDGPLGGADIGNGTVRLGVNRFGHLYVLLQDDPLGIGALGLRYVPTGAAAIEASCPCEGWGIMDLELGSKGGADGANGVGSLDLESFTFDGTSATSVVNAMRVFRVTHAFRPSPVTPYLYEITVTMKNISIFTVKPMYRRVMDWDISDSPAEWLTLKRGTSVPMRTDLGSENSWELPFFQSAGRNNEDFEDDGPFKDDRPHDPAFLEHGALFDLIFAPIAPGEEKSFRLFYGAAGTEAAALAALAAVGAEAYSLAQPNTTEDGPTLGTPQTFMFGFSANTNRAPNANAGADQTRECTSHNGATVRLDGTGSSDPDGAADIDSYEWYEAGTRIATGAQPEVTLGLGRHRLTLRVKDKQGATAEDEVDITVQDTQAPTIDLTADPAELWPPNHRMVSVARGISASDICDMSPSLVVTVTSNEAVDGLGDGDTSPDWEIKDNGNGTFDVLVRSERSGTGDGRVYTISVTSTDASGNTSSRTATVKVAHDKGMTNK